MDQVLAFCINKGWTSQAGMAGSCNDDNRIYDSSIKILSDCPYRKEWTQVLEKKCYWPNMLGLNSKQDIRHCFRSRLHRSNWQDVRIGVNFNPPVISREILVSFSCPEKTKHGVSFIFISFHNKCKGWITCKEKIIKILHGLIDWFIS